MIEYIMMKMNRRYLTFVLLLMAVSIAFSVIDPLANLSPLVPFSFTYEYRTPREWQVEVLTGTSLDISSFTDQGTGTMFNSGQIGLKFGLPGDIVLVGTWPWLGLYLSTDEGQFVPEFDMSLNIPISFGSDLGSSGAAINLNNIIKKTLPPVRFSAGHNLLFSNRYDMDSEESTSATVGKEYLGLGLEWQINPYARVYGEYRYQLGSIISYGSEGMRYELSASDPEGTDNIFSIGGEYVLDTENFTMKTTAGYSINVTTKTGFTSFNTHTVGIGISFLFPFPIQPQDWENQYSPLGENP